MSVPLPNLDDRTYDDLVAEALSLLPGIAPEWTDHNESDPGIALIELFAWIIEQLLYRVDRIPEANERAFLKLLNGPDWEPAKDLDGIGAARGPTEGHSADVSNAVLALRDRYRAATAEDFENLTLRGWPRSKEAEALELAGGDAQIRRARCVPDRNLDLEKRAVGGPDPGHISLIIVPGTPKVRPEPTPELLGALWKWLDVRRLLTVRHHVVGPSYTEVSVRHATLSLREGARALSVRESAAMALDSYFNPLTGGPDGLGWPFGRDVHLSEVYAILDRVPGVDYVSEVKLSANVGRSTTSGVRIGPDELVDLSIGHDAIRTEEG